jgi:2Fe-2S ferredoxin
MPKVHFKDRNNNLIETVEVTSGASVMEAARFFSKNEYIEGIEAICGGGCVCGTCHVHVDKEWLNKIKPIDEFSPEREVLEYVDEYNETHSRCACQIIMQDELDGLVVKIP